MTSTKKSGLTSDKLDASLMQLSTWFEGAVCPFILLGETARSVKKDNRVQGSKIEIGVREKHLARSTGGMLRDLIKDIKEFENEWRFESADVPVVMKILRRKNKYIVNPDTVVYNFDDYLLPNPFAGYWKTRGLIR